MADDVWKRLAGERRVAAEYLSGLSPADWDTPSWCAGWSNRDVLAHLVDGSQSTPWRFVRTFVASGFDFDKFIAKGQRRQEGRPVPDLLADWSAVLDRHTQPGAAMVVETLVHTEDIRSALGHGPIAHHGDNLVFVADNVVKSGAPIRGKRRAAGLRFVATDAEWRSGDGPTVEGPLVAVVMAVAGRTGAHRELVGDGVATLVGRA